MMPKYSKSQLLAVAVIVVMACIAAMVVWEVSHGHAVPVALSAVAEFCGGVVLLVCRSIAPSLAGFITPYLSDTSATKPSAKEADIEQRVAAALAKQVPPVVADAEAYLTQHAATLQEKISNTPINLNISRQLDQKSLLDGIAAVAEAKAAPPDAAPLVAEDAQPGTVAAAAIASELARQSPLAAAVESIVLPKPAAPAASVPAPAEAPVGPAAAPVYPAGEGA